MLEYWWPCKQQVGCKLCRLFRFTQRLNFAFQFLLSELFETRISLIFTNSICADSWNSCQKFFVRLAARSLTNFSWQTAFGSKTSRVSERPRERLVARGPDALTHAELIAILLRTACRARTWCRSRKTSCKKFGSLNALALATVDELKLISGVGPDKAATLVAAFALARRMEQERREESPVLDNPATVVNFMRETNRLLNVESFQVLLLNTRGKLDPRGGNFPRPARHHPGSSTRSFPRSDCGERGGHRAGP